MKVKVKVEGYNEFQIDMAKVGELLTWLSANDAIRITEKNKVQEVKDNTFTGRELISE